MMCASDLNKNQKVELLRLAYPKGTKIRLCEMVGEPQMPYGLEGTVHHIDDIGQIHVNWENGSSLALQDHDTFSVIS